MRARMRVYQEVRNVIFLRTEWMIHLQHIKNCSENCQESSWQGIGKQHIFFRSNNFINTDAAGKFFQ